VVGGDAGLDGGEDENLAVAGDFEDGSAAVADEEIALAVKCSAGGDTHAFRVEGGFARAVDAVDVALSARGDEEVAFWAEGEAGGVEDSGDERSSAPIGADTDDGDGSLLSALARDGGVDHAGAADSGAGDGVKAAGELAGNFELRAVTDTGGGAHFDKGSSGGVGNAEGDAAGAAHEDHGVMGADNYDGRSGRSVAEVCAVEFDFAFGQSCRGYDFFDMGFRCHLFPVGLDASARHFFFFKTRCAGAMLLPKHTARLRRRRRRCPSLQGGVRDGGWGRAW